MPLQTFKFCTWLTFITDRIFPHFRWFAPFVMQWLNENDDVSLEFLRNAYAKDKRDKVLNLSCYTEELIGLQYINKFLISLYLIKKKYLLFLFHLVFLIILYSLQAKATRNI